MTQNTIIQVQMVDSTWLNIHSILADTFTVSNHGRVPYHDATVYNLHKMHPEMKFRDFELGNHAHV